MTASAGAATAALRRAVAGRGSIEEGRSAVRALLAAGEAAPAARRRPASPEFAASRYETTLERAFDGLATRFAAGTRLRSLGEELASKLVDVCRVSPGEALRRALEAEPDLRLATIEALVRRVDRLALDRPAEAVVLSRFVVSAATSPPPPGAVRFDELKQRDLEASSWRVAADAAYRAGELVEAERALLKAREAFAAGSLAPALDADLCRVESEIRSDQSRFAEARRLAERAVRLYRRAGERTSEARATISLALKWYYEGELGRALETTERGLALLDPERDGRLRLAAEFNRVFWWNDAGRPAEARAALPALAALAEREGGASDRLRLAWLEARIVAKEGDLEHAVELYERVLERGLELDVVYDSATVAFELATHLLELGRAAEVLPLAETVSRIFSTQGVAPEAPASVLLAADALRQGAAAHEALRLLHERGRRDRSGAR